jgi:hypothetical protein
MPEKPAAATTDLAVDPTSPSPERMRVKEMFKRVMIVAELLAKSSECRGQSHRQIGNAS